MLKTFFFFIQTYRKGVWPFRVLGLFASRLSVCCEVEGDEVFRPEEMPAFLDAFAELRKATISFVVTVRSHRTARLPQDGFS